MNKAQIIQRLLEEKHITVEEAMTLMTQDPSPMPTQVNPYSPPFRVGDPDWTWNPYRNPFWYEPFTTNETNGDNNI